MGRRSSRVGISTTSGFGLSAFSRDELDSLHYGTLQILQDTGIKVVNEEAVEIFYSGGAAVERFDGYGLVKLPSYLVEQTAFFAPRMIVYDARNPADDFVAEPNRVGFTTFSGCINVIDLETRGQRRSTKEDCGDVARVCDALDEICVVNRTVLSNDAPLESMPLHNLEMVLRNSGKHIFIGAENAANLRRMVQMAAACAGGEDNFRKRPIFTPIVCPMSPLTMTSDCCEIIIEAARLGLGLLILPMAMSGGTSSATLAGTLVTHNCEVLSSIVLAQLTAKGTPCTYGSTSTILDLRFGTTALGAPEFGMINAGIAKLAQYYKLPSWVGGGATDSKLPDPQAAYESTLSATLSALSGGNILFGAGVLEQGLTFDLAKLVLDSEMIRMVQKAISGIAITDEMLAMDVIHEVGPGGAYLSHDHSFKSMRGQSHSTLFDRRVRSGWLEAPGGTDIVAKATRSALEILQNHTPPPLPAGAAEEMQAILADYEQELGPVATAQRA